MQEHRPLLDGCGHPVSPLWPVGRPLEAGQCRTAAALVDPPERAPARITNRGRAALHGDPVFLGRGERGNTCGTYVMKAIFVRRVRRAGLVPELRRDGRGVEGTAFWGLSVQVDEFL